MNRLSRLLIISLRIVLIVVALSGIGWRLLARPAKGLSPEEQFALEIAVVHDPQPVAFVNDSPID